MTEQVRPWSTIFEIGLTAEPDTRIGYAIVAVKRELVYNGFLGGGMNPDSPRFGSGAAHATVAFQKSIGVPKRQRDGKVGPATGKALWKLRLANLEEAFGIPNEWLCRQVGWESGFDPAAVYFNSDGSTDRGLVQSNSKSESSIPDAQAYDPAFILLDYAGRLSTRAKAFASCDVDRWKLAVAAHRSPVGAKYWCDHPEVEPVKHDDLGPDSTAKDWGEQVAYYVSRVESVVCWSP